MSLKLIFVKSLFDKGNIIFSTIDRDVGNLSKSLVVKSLHREVRTLNKVVMLISLSDLKDTLIIVFLVFILRWPLCLPLLTLQ